MSKFMGGSAFTMARDIAEGYVLVSERTFKGLAPSDVVQLLHEVDRHLRELRGEPSALDDAAALQARQRKILRLQSAVTVARAYQQKTRRG